MSRSGPLSAFWTRVFGIVKSWCCCRGSPWTHKRSSSERSPSASSSPGAPPQQWEIGRWRRGGRTSARWKWRSTATPSWGSHTVALGKWKRRQTEKSNNAAQKVSHGNNREIMTSICPLEIFKQAHIWTHLTRLKRQFSLDESKLTWSKRPGNVSFRLLGHHGCSHFVLTRIHYGLPLAAPLTELLGVLFFYFCPLHEAGHNVVAGLEGLFSPVHCACIIPRLEREAESNTLFTSESTLTSCS